MKMENILTCNNLTKLYGAKPALKGLNLTVPAGKIVGLLGTNGSGKTTLIKLAAGLLTPSSGEILVDGKAPGLKSKSVVSYLPERTYLYEWMTVSQILDFFCDFYADFDRHRAEEMLSALSVPVTSPLKTLSKGTKEKVQLILVMSRRAKLYLLDEPIGGVDPATRDYIMRTIITNYSEDALIIISTHLIADIEQILSDAVFINRGMVFLADSEDNIRQSRGKSVDEVFREVFRC